MKGLRKKIDKIESTLGSAVFGMVVTSIIFVHLIRNNYNRRKTSERNTDTDREKDE
jgi:hypothetical protein